MSFKRFPLFIACLLLGLGWAVTAQAKTYALAGDTGAQLHIGGGLPLPIQFTNPTRTGTVFPELLIPIRLHRPTVMGTTVMSARQRLTVPTGVLKKNAAQLTLGNFPANPNLYAVASNLSFTWPAASAVLSTGARTGPTTVTHVTGLGNIIRYSNAAGKFGGPARFFITPGPPAGKMAPSPITIYAIAIRPAGNPPCTHTALTPVPFPGPGNPACVAALGQAFVTAASGAHGGPVGVLVTTPGGTPGAVAVGGPVPGVGIGKFGPIGEVTFFTFTPAMTMMGFTNMATSFGYPWTTGVITVSAPLAAGAPEVFTITGQDNRTAGGAGTIQLVAGSLSQRTLTGPNANRAWVRLVLFEPSGTPTMSPAGIAATAALMVLAVAYVLRRRLSR
jgi:hypothetical protein